MLPAGKWINVTPPIAALNNASAVTGTIDTLGFDYCEIAVFLGVLNVALTALKVQESDLSNMGGAADITGLVFGTSNNIAGSTSTLPASTQDNNVYLFNIDLRPRKRYIDLVATADVGSTLISACARLTRAEQTPTTAAQQGAVEVLQA